MRTVEEILKANHAQSAEELHSRFGDPKSMQVALKLEWDEVIAICEVINRNAGTVAAAQQQRLAQAKVEARMAEKAAAREKERAEIERRNAESPG